MLFGKLILLFFAEHRRDNFIISSVRYSNYSNENDCYNCGCMSIAIPLFQRRIHSPAFHRIMQNI